MPTAETILLTTLPQKEVVSSPNAPERDTQELVAKAQAGCTVSFERLVHEYQDRIYGYLVQMSGNSHDAEDLTQETFIKAYKHLRSFDGRARFSTWLFAIAKNSVLTMLRRKRVHEPIDNHQATLTTTAQEMNSDERESIWALARTLKPNLYEVLWLFYAEGFSLKEISAITKLNSITVRVNLHRARAALARKLRRYHRESSMLDEWSCKTKIRCHE
jgi:RNA polymerase sigma-70 factor, ECF subfamily